MKSISAFLLAMLTGLSSSFVFAEDASFARYKASSRDIESRDIRTNLYGASTDAPDALGIDNIVPDFVLPKAGGGNVSLSELRENGDVVIIFYRGHW
ncbi:MAG: hypothetical protein KUG75_03640 [Pseudomonadales bacterium]|nr:hypothetical protein [Pseudomonadales bacterium]